MKTEIHPIMNPLRDMDDFTRAYIECALWSSHDNADESGGEPLDKNYNWTNISEPTLAKILADCAQFQTNLAMFSHGMSSDRAGHCFWLSRNGHGSGFFDEDTCEETLRDELQEAARKYSSFDLYVGDDGKIYN